MTVVLPRAVNDRTTWQKTVPHATNVRNSEQGIVVHDAEMGKNPKFWLSVRFWFFIDGTGNTRLLQIN